MSAITWIYPSIYPLVTALHISCLRPSAAKWSDSAELIPSDQGCMDAILIRARQMKQMREKKRVNHFGIVFPVPIGGLGD